MTITSSRKANISCKQGGGSKKQGGPLVANISNLTNRAEKENGVFGARNRNIVFIGLVKVNSCSNIWCCFINGIGKERVA